MISYIKNKKNIVRKSDASESLVIKEPFLMSVDNSKLSKEVIREKIYYNIILFFHMNPEREKERIMFYFDASKYNFNENDIEILKQMLEKNNFRFVYTKLFESCDYYYISLEKSI